MVDDRRARIRRNMARAWAYAAAAYQASAGALANISWDLYGAPVGFAGGLVSATLSTPPASGPTLFVTTNDINDAYNEGTPDNHTFSASIGTASSNRRVFFAGIKFNNNNTVVAASIGGVAATIHYGGGGQSVNPIIFSAVVPTGATADISVSYSGGTTFGNLLGRMFYCDNSLFANPSPDVRFVSSAGGVVGTVTTSANAIVLFAGAHAVTTCQESTVSPASNIAGLTVLHPAANYCTIGYANSVSAQVGTIPFQAVTASDACHLVVLGWR